MNELLVSKCLECLNVFHSRNGQDLWVNEIARRVTDTTDSKDTPKIKESIKLLERALIIQTVSSKYKQKEMKILTPLGQDVSNFVDDLKNVATIILDLGRQS